MLELVREQTHVLSIASKIHSEVEGTLHNRQREFYLRQQLKAIRSELGEEVGLDGGFSSACSRYCFCFVLFVQEDCCFPFWGFMCYFQYGSPQYIM